MWTKERWIKDELRLHIKFGLIFGVERSVNKRPFALQGSHFASVCVIPSNLPGFTAFHRHQSCAFVCRCGLWRRKVWPRDMKVTRNLELDLHIIRMVIFIHVHMLSYVCMCKNKQYHMYIYMYIFIHIHIVLHVHILKFGVWECAQCQKSFVNYWNDVKWHHLFWL